MKSILPLLLLVAIAGEAAGQGVPKIDFAPSCRAAAASPAGISQEFEACRKSEEAARDVLAQQWGTFPAADRESCHRLATTGTPGTYTELLTCLEMRREARRLRDPKTPKQK
jgi:hypothetical protein